MLPNDDDLVDNGHVESILCRRKNEGWRGKKEMKERGCIFRTARLYAFTSVTEKGEQNA